MRLDNRTSGETRDGVQDFEPAEELAQSPDQAFQQISRSTMEPYIQSQRKIASMALLESTAAVSSSSFGCYQELFGVCDHGAKRRVANNNCFTGFDGYWFGDRARCDEVSRAERLVMVG